MNINFKIDEDDSSLLIEEKIAPQVDFRSLNDESLSELIKQLTQDQKFNYLCKEFKLLQEFIDDKNIIEIRHSLHIIIIFIQNFTRISHQLFDKIVQLYSNPNLKDLVMTFVLSTAENNPSLMRGLLSNKYYMAPEMKSRIDLLECMINSSQEICEQLIICDNLIDKIESDLLESQQTGDDYHEFWIQSINLLNLIFTKCSYNTIIFEKIHEICIYFLKIHPQVTIPVIHCLITLSERAEKNNAEYFSSILEELPFLDSILNDNQCLEEVQPVIHLIMLCAIKYDENKLYEGYLTHLLALSHIWNEKEFESVFLDIFKIISATLVRHRDFITEIQSNDYIKLAVILLSDGGTFVKEETSLFFKILCDPCFWDIVFPLFEQNTEIISSLFMLLSMDSSDKTKLNILYGLDSLLNQLQLKNQLDSNTFSVYLLDSSFEAFSSVLLYTTDKQIIQEAELIKSTMDTIVSHKNP